MTETAYECRNCGYLYYNPPYSYVSRCFVCPECHGVQFAQVELEQVCLPEGRRDEEDMRGMRSGI